MRKRIVPIVIVLGLVGLLVYQLRGEATVECRGCMTFGSLRRCATAVGPDENRARAEAQNMICAQVAKGVTQAVACAKQNMDEVACQQR